MNLFWDKVDKSGKCWLWLASKQGQYGCFTIGGKNYQAHRVSYPLAWGDIPAGYVVDHLCANKLCVRPSHLEAITLAENNRRKRWTVEQRRVRYYELRAIRGPGEGMLDEPETEQLVLDLFEPVMIEPVFVIPAISITLPSGSPQLRPVTRRVIRDAQGLITAIEDVSA